jgi:hypothetical protein
MPKGSEKTDEWSIYNIDQDGNIKYKTSIPPRFLPDAFVSFLEQVKQELNDYAKRTVNLLRWRCGTEGYHNPFSSRGGLWSFDDNLGNHCQVHSKLMRGQVHTYVHLMKF